LSTTAPVNLAAANFRWYLAGVAAWFIGYAMLMVLFPWLVVIELAESAKRVGFAQMAMMAPTLLFVLIGGTIADRIGPRPVIVIALLACGLPPLVLAGAIAAGTMSYAMLIVFAVVLGTAQAFVTPAREALLPAVVVGSIQRTVTLVVFVMFGVQIFGFVIGGAGDHVGAVPLILTQGAITAFGAFAFARLKLPAWKPPVPHAGGAISGFLSSYATVLGYRQLRPVMVLNLTIGVSFMGAFMVGIPLLIRELHAGTPAEIAFANVANMAGVIVSVGALMKLGGVRRCGRALLLGLIGGAVTVGLLAIPLPYWALMGLVFVWGLFGGVSITMGRTLVQEMAPASHRTRVMAMYVLAFLGGAPLGSLLMGYCVAWFGPLNAMLVPSVGMTVLCIVVACATDLWRMQPPYQLTAVQEPAR
jgi:MFS family permease